MTAAVINLEAKWRCSRAQYITVHLGGVAKYGAVKVYTDIPEHFPTFSHILRLLRHSCLCLCLCPCLSWLRFSCIFRTFSNFLNISHGLKNLQPISVYQDFWVLSRQEHWWKVRIYLHKILLEYIAELIIKLSMYANFGKLWGILGNFASIYALSCGENWAQK